DVRFLEVANVLDDLARRVVHRPVAGEPVVIVPVTRAGVRPRFVGRRHRSWRRRVLRSAAPPAASAALRDDTRTGERRSDDGRAELHQIAALHCLTIVRSSADSMAILSFSNTVPVMVTVCARCAAIFELFLPSTPPVNW